MSASNLGSSTPSKRRALETRHPNHPALERYAEAARLLTGNREASPQEGVEWVRELGDEMKIPALSAHGMAEAQIPEAVHKTMQASSLKGNPLALSEEECGGILRRAM
jgi:alcohol dehydrogenase class IV